ncbi:GntR family transcriptional regulator [Virgibacillus soli]|uniref:GntR family transcriptional regulator n=1 Tax=Paracerasibacillus soli TaxID=480284 RepID=UPI0035E927EB
MLIKIDFESDAPIYTQLKNEIIAGIAKGELVPGEALPSVRSLGSDLGINLHTVNKAYKQLGQDGYILIHRQRGVVINPDGPPQADETYIENLKSILDPILAESICRGVTKEDFFQICQSLYKEYNIGEGEK